MSSAAHDPVLSRQLRISDGLFRSYRAAPLWLVVRVLLGWAWFTAGWDKVQNERWMSDGAPALKGFVAGVNATWDNRAEAHGHPDVAYGWYVDYMNWVGANSGVFGPVVAISELLIGLGLILGCLTGIAALAGISLNLMYVFGGSAGENGTYLIAGMLLVLAWRVAGRLGVDGLLLPRLARLGKSAREAFDPVVEIPSQHTSKTGQQRRTLVN